MSHINAFMHRLAGILPTTLLLALAGPAQAAMTISDNPLFITVAVPPNIILTLDDSGSMRRAFVPENCAADISDCSLLDNRYEKSAKRNLIYYDPTVTYTAPKNAAGVSLTTSFTSAYRNGFDPAFGTINLSTGYKPTAYLYLNGSATEAYMGHYESDVECNTATNTCRYKNESGTWVNTTTSCSGSTPTAEHQSCRGTHVSAYAPAGMPAYYYVFDSTNASCDGTATDNDCYDIKFVSSTSGPGGTDEQQNFANWYSFYRTRNLATVSAASLAFAGLDETARVAWQALNSCWLTSSSLPTSDCDGWKDNLSASNTIKTFTGTHKNNFYAWLTRLPTSGGTPLPPALERAGEYYKSSGEGSPYDDDFTAAGSTQTSCRRNYHILMTDGIWTVAGSAGHADNTGASLPEAYTGATPSITAYAPLSPYKDSHANTLADSAFKYWITDLRPDLNNDLTPLLSDLTGTATAQYWNPKNNPASWQHMVNYTIGLGLTGYLSATGLTWDGDMYGGSYTFLANGTTAWPQPSTAVNDPDNVADLWHAAINSRGKFFSADDPAALSAAFKAVLSSITADSGSAAALSANSTSLKSGTVVYQAKFNSVDWSGTLLALPVFGDGSVGSPDWDASTLIPAHGVRKMFTHNGSAGVSFNNCASLSASQQALLAVGGVSCADRLNWLRGDHSKEQPAGSLRKRVTTVMADIINSDPAYVKATDYGYAALPAGTPGQATYASYVSGNASRQAMVYVGTNGGTLEAINAVTGVELFSYVPAGVYDNLSLLTNPAYTHRFYVDGAPSVGDAYIGGGWKTVLVGGLNAGGKTIYALNITNPTGFGASDVMWEFSHAHLGLSYSQPQIGILESGQWVAVFGNGYNSTEGGAYLYVVDLASGVAIRTIKAMDTVGVDDNNGLSSPVLYDTDGNGLMDTVYAGDLQGNLWKFDLSSTSSASWGVAYGGSPLFRACRVEDNGDAVCDAGEQQPITSKPEVTSHTLGGQMVVFGTGRYLTTSDVSDTSTQSFYGIRDNGTAVANRTKLQEQTVTLQASAFGFDVRSVSTASVDWAWLHGWYLDLPDAPGERVISMPIIKANRAIFVTTVPSSDPCAPGGGSWLMEVDLLTGGAPPVSVFDLSGSTPGVPDDKFDASDKVSGQVVAGIKSTVGMSKTPVWLDKSTDMAFKVMTGTSGGFMSPKNNPGGGGGGKVERVYWMQIR